MTRSPIDGIVGTIVSVEGRKITLSIGGREGIAEGEDFSVFAHTPGELKFVGIGKVVSVQEVESEAVVTYLSDEHPLEIGNIVAFGPEAPL